MEKHFQEKITFDTHSTRKLPPLLASLKKFKVSFEKKHLFGPEKKNKFRSFWELVLFQSPSTANLLQFGKKKFTFRIVNEHH